MKKILSKSLLLLLALTVVIGCFTACDNTPEPTPTPEVVDYVAGLKLDMTSSTKKLEVTVKTFIDGDTTHFNVPDSEIAGGVLKARYLAINTPESTGKIEEYGKKASNFTKSKLSSATSIYIESDDGKWNADSTGSRYMVWVWYKGAGDTEYRNLNLEILQNGLAIASNTANNRYGETCMNALNQAKAEKLNVFSGQKDPDFYYGDAVELSLLELRTNITEYNGVKVAFEGVVAVTYSGGIYVEELDSETGLYSGIYVYYQNSNVQGDGLAILERGNRVRIVGTVSEFNGTYQVSGLQYRQMKPDDPSNIQKLGDGFEAAYAEVTAADFASGKVNVTLEEEVKTFDYAEIIMHSTVFMDNLTVSSIYTTNNGGDSDGAMTITCTAGGKTIKIRTEVLRYENGDMVTADEFKGKTISVYGVVDSYDGSYQIKVLSYKNITIKN